MSSASSELVKISVRMPKSLLTKISRLHARESISDIVRHLLERELEQKKVLKAHMKLYGRFRPGDFDESLL